MAEEKRGLKYDASAKWDECVDLSVRRFVYSSLAGAFGGLLLFRSPATRWAAAAFGVGGGEPESGLLEQKAEGRPYAEFPWLSPCLDSAPISLVVPSLASTVTASDVEVGTAPFHSSRSHAAVVVMIFSTLIQLASNRTLCRTNGDGGAALSLRATPPPWSYLCSHSMSMSKPKRLFIPGDALSKKSKLFVHFVLDPISVPGSSDGLSFAARYGCLVLIENVERLDVGALVSIRGVCRVKIANFVQAEPYLTGVVLPLKDENPGDSSNISATVAKVKESLHNLNSLEIKLKAPKEAPLQTLTANSLMWAEKSPSLDCDEAYILPLEERLSFAAYQPISGSTESDLQKLQKEKLRAMEIRETLERLDGSLRLAKENISVVAAKLAIQSLEMP
ncbi:hypothetical protein SAY86_012556 [Trapa natans]|uniref:Lon N-terminal domain-containing protein n=1 Tax=Trapa natans TaxID=22666 RepID=A0AAN7LXV3_TRANT|nr:hypothetical protein SAY86_012556 [Trapa natans]